MCIEIAWFTPPFFDIVTCADEHFETLVAITVLANKFAIIWYVFHKKRIDADVFIGKDKEACVNNGAKMRFVLIPFNKPAESTFIV
jgi:hypothetical protein